MSDDEYYDDDIDVIADLDEFDEIDPEDENLNLEDIKDADEIDQDEDDIDEDDIDEDEIDEDNPLGDEHEVLISDYFHKIIDDPKQDYISTTSVIPRDIIVVDAGSRITSRFITKKEYARVVGVRSKLIALYAKVFTDVTNIIDPKIMAIKEIKEKKCPLMLKREIGFRGDTKICEIWGVNELIIQFD